MAADDADNSQNDHAVQQERTEVITGLQQNPNGGNGGYGNIHAHDDDPDIIAEIDGMPVEANVHTDGNADNADNGGNTQRGVAAVDKETKEDCHQDEHNGDDGGGSIGRGCGNIHSAVSGIGGLESVGHDGRESGHHKDQGQIGEDNEQFLGLGADCIADDFTDGLALMANGSKQGTKVMHAAEEDAADEHPQHHRNPAKHSSLNGSIDGTGAGDRGKVMAHKHRTLGRTVILAVFQFMGRGNTLVIDTPLLGQPSAVENITEQQNDNANDQKQCSIHKVFSFPNIFFFALQNSVFFNNCAALLPLALEKAFSSSSTARPVWKSIQPQKAILKLL